MKKYHSFEDFSQALKEEKVPDIDINIIKEVTTNKMPIKSIGRSRRLTTVLITALLVLCIGAAAIAADTIVSKWQLLNRKGEVVLEYSNNLLTGDDAMQALDADSFYDTIENNIKSNLQKGEAAIVATKDRIGFLEYAEYTEDIDLLKQESSFRFKAPVKLPKGYNFLNGVLNHQIDISNMQEKINELKEKAKQSKAGYLVEKIQLKPDVSQVALKYSKDQREMTIHITKLQGKNLRSTSTAFRNTEVLKIGDKEVIHNWSGKGSLSMYLFIDEYDNQKWLYMISAEQLRVDELTSLIESMEF